MPTSSEKHPHEPFRGLPVQLDASDLRVLSRVRPARALAAVLIEWSIIAAAIAACQSMRHPIAYLAGIFVIGSRQHALAIIAHDAVHFRFLPNKWWNDWVADLFVAWPIFLSVELFRSVHAPHHRYLGERPDGNRIAWGTHDRQGRITPEWTYPKSRAGLVSKIARRACGWTGLVWIVRGLSAPLTLRWRRSKSIVFVTYFLAVATALVVSGLGVRAIVYWLVPYCTWHVAAQYVRLVCEHSGHIATVPGFGKTRSTLPGLLGRFFVLPCNVGYHLEHHFYPSVPWYNLPDLHCALRAHALFAENANVQVSILGALGQCIERPGRVCQEAG